jgi:undecaprenyl-diphosphatase
MWRAIVTTQERTSDLDDTVALSTADGAGAWPATWVIPLVLGMLGIMLLLPLDMAVSTALRSVKLGGDIKRELNFMQQYGQGASILIVGLVIWVMDPDRRRRFLDWGAAMVVTWGSVQLVKMFVGRPRPSVGDPLSFIGPFGAYTLDADAGPQSAWAFWLEDASRLWSFPSSHTAFAMVTSVFLVALYPRLKGIAIGAVVIVGLARIIFGAHYPSDVLVGAGVGYICTREALRQRWGEVALARIRARLPQRPLASDDQEPEIDAAPAFRFAPTEIDEDERPARAAN